MSTELKAKAQDAARRARQAETHPQRMVEAAELQARSMARIADALEKIAAAGLVGQEGEQNHG